MNPIQTLADEALIQKLRGAEHDFVERKPRGQKGDWLQVAVAFANSAPIGWPAVLFVGVDDNGVPQQGPDRLEDLSKSVGAVFEQAYPPIYFDIRPLHMGDRACLAVVIPGSENRPHFAGKAYVRVGPETRDASESQFAELMASRNSKARAIQEWIGKEIGFVHRNHSTGNFNGYRDDAGPPQAVVKGCNAHFATFGSFGNNATDWSEPLFRLELGFDNQAKRLVIFRYNDR